MFNNKFQKILGVSATVLAFDGAFCSDPTTTTADATPAVASSRAFEEQVQALKDRYDGIVSEIKRDYDRQVKAREGREDSHILPAIRSLKGHINSQLDMIKQNKVQRMNIAKRAFDAEEQMKDTIIESNQEKIARLEQELAQLQHNN